MLISLSSSFRGMTVSNAELKSTNNTLVLLYAGGLKMLQNAIQAKHGSKIAGSVGRLGELTRVQLT